jgi:transposase-like protein
VDRWQVDEPDVKVAGQWRDVYRVIDQSTQVIEVVESAHPDARAAHRFLQWAIGATKVRPAEVTDQAPLYPAVLEELRPAAWHRTDRYANRVEGDYGTLRARLRPMRGLEQDRSARVVIVGHALIQNVRRGHYELVIAIRTPRGCFARPARSGRRLGLLRCRSGGRATGR